MPRPCQSTVAQIGDIGGDVAAEHVHGHRIADFQIETFGDFLLERDQRRALIIGAPPFAFDQPRAVRNLGRVA